MEPFERAMWLKRAARKGWSRNMLRQQVLTQTAPQEEPTERALVQMHVSTEQGDRWASAAGRQGRELTEWIVLCLEQAADLQGAPRP